MKIKSASIILLITSIIWLLTELYQMIVHFNAGWLNFDEPVAIILRVLEFSPPIALIFLSSVLRNAEILKSEEISDQLMQSSNNVSFMSIGDWLITFLICCIPIVGIVMMFVWAFGNTNQPSKKTWAQAWLIFLLIITVLYAFIMASLLL